MNKRNAILGLVLSVTLAVASVAHATSSIGINFSSDQGGTAFTLVPTDVTGVVPQANWNDAYAAGGSGGPVGLVDNTGAPTGALVTWSSGNNWDNGVPTGTPAGKLLHSFLDAGSGSPSVATVTISGLPVTYGPNDVYVYIASNHGTDQLPGLSDFTVNGSTQTVIQDSSGSTAFTLATSVTPGTYIKFGNVTGSTITLTAQTGVGGAFRSSVDGIQIVSQQVPEPSTFALIAVGLVSLLGFARKLRKS